MVVPIGASASAGKEKMLSYRWAIFSVMAVAYFFVYFHRTSTAVLADSIGSTFGVGVASIALLGSLYFYSYAVMQLPSGILSDKWGPRRTVTIFVTLAAAGSLVMGIAPSFEVALIGRILIGVGVAVIYIPIMKILATWFRRYEFASLSGILLLIGNVGALAATTPLVLMTEALGMQGVFIALGIVTLIIAAMCWIIVRDHPSDMGLPAIEEIVSEETGEPIKESTSAKMPMREALRITFGSGRKFWPLAVWFFFMYGTLMVYQGLQAGPFYGTVYGWSKTEYSLLLMAVAIGMILGSPISGIISDRVLKSRKKVLVVGSLGYTAVWAVIWFTSGALANYWSQFAINFALGFFGGFLIVSFAQIKELFPIYIAGTSTAALNLFPFAGGAILQLLSGYMVLDKTPEQFQTLWFAMFLMMIVASVAAVLSLEARDLEKKEKRKV